MDFITNLALRDRCNQLCIIIDRCAMMGHFISLQMNESKNRAPRTGICPHDIEITLDTNTHSFRPGLVIYIEVVEGIPNTQWCETPDFDRVLSRDR
jgi:hypothetical protein